MPNKKPYNVEGDIERLAKRGQKSKLRESVKKKQAKEKVKKEKGTWVDRLKKRVKEYLKSEKKK